MQLDAEKVKKTIHQLELEKAGKVRDLEEAEKRLAELKPRVESYFGTTDLDKLKEKKAELEAKIESSVRALEELGVKF